MKTYNKQTKTHKFHFEINLKMSAARTPNLETVKRIVIAIITNEENGLAADLLDREYRGWENQNLPFNRFGYTSLLQFIQEELSENIEIEQRGNNIILRSKSTNESNHIGELKKHEKHSNKKRKQTNGLGYVRNIKRLHPFKKCVFITNGSI